MNSELQKSSIRYLLQKEGEQQACGKVRSESLHEDMSLIGFVPYSVVYSDFLLSLGVDLNDQLVITPYFVRFSKQDPVYPIFKSLRKANGMKYKVNEKLLISTIPEEVRDKVKSIYSLRSFKWIETKPMSGSRILESWRKQKDIFLRLFQNVFEEVDSSMEDSIELNYNGQPDDIELSGHITELTTITNDFLCLCSYMNKVTGLPSYIVLGADDVIRLLSDE